MGSASKATTVLTVLFFFCAMLAATAPDWEVADSSSNPLGSSDHRAANGLFHSCIDYITNSSSLTCSGQVEGGGTGLCVKLQAWRALGVLAILVGLVASCFLAADGDKAGVIFAGVAAVLSIMGGIAAILFLLEGRTIGGTKVDADVTISTLGFGFYAYFFGVALTAGGVIFALFNEEKIKTAKTMVFCGLSLLVLGNASPEWLHGDKQVGLGAVSYSLGSFYECTRNSLSLNCDIDSGACRKINASQGTIILGAILAFASALVMKLSEREDVFKVGAIINTAALAFVTTAWALFLDVKVGSASDIGWGFIAAVNSTFFGLGAIVTGFVAGPNDDVDNYSASGGAFVADGDNDDHYNSAPIGSSPVDAAPADWADDGRFDGGDGGEAW